MSQRERRTLDQTHASGITSVVELPSRAERPMADTAPNLLDWPTLTATAQQQEQLLAAAQQHSVLYPHQLPSETPCDPAEHVRAMLELIDAGQTSELEAPRAATFEPLDRELDSMQQAAVAVALATPDLALIVGPAGTGKTRTLIELIRQACLRGGRVAVISPVPQSIDQLLLRLDRHGDTFALRLCGPDESPESLSPTSTRFTPDGRLLALQQSSLAKAQSEIAKLETQIRALNHTAELHDQLQSLSTQLDQLAARQNAVAEQLSQVEPTVRAMLEQPQTASESLARALAESAETLRIERERLEAERVELLTEQSHLQQQLLAIEAEVQNLTETRTEKRWWKPEFWKSSSVSKVQIQSEGLTQQRQELERKLANIVQRLEQVQSELDATQTAHAARQEQIALREIERIRGELTAEQTACQAQADDIEQAWTNLIGQIEQPLLRPQLRTPQAIAQARSEQQQQINQLHQLLETTRVWADELSRSPRQALANMLQLVNVLVGLPSLFDRDDLEACLPATPLDWLIVDDAQHLSESAFVKLATLARRWVLVGDTSYELTQLNGIGSSEQQNRNRKLSRCSTSNNLLAIPGLFGRLWRGLHREVWVREDQRLCCRLQYVPPSLEQFVECEPLADHPGVELRICIPPEAGPFLAEVSFPPGMSIVQAKRLIFVELGELPIQGRGRSARWHDDGDRVSFYLEEGSPPPLLLASVPLDEGIRESLVNFLDAEQTGQLETVCSTCRIDFDMKAGWTREKAQEWVLQHLIYIDTGRAIHLAVQYRQPSGLARFVGDLFPHAGCRLPANEPTNQSAGMVEFVPVPALAEQRRDGSRAGGRNGSSAAATRRLPIGLRSGAGLEIDLADPRQRELLPTELRDCLPSVGIVNLAEAQQIVRLVEAQPQPLCVVALYATQAELIRQLLARSKAANRQVPVEGPDTTRAWEHEIVLVSLTRSHPSRAVSLGDDPSVVLAAFSRARCRLTIVGDPGTLVRRSQYQGPVDHLNERASAVECAWVTRLVQYLNGNGSRNVRFRLTEGPRL